MSERTIDATPQRRRQARLEGRFPRSRELTICALTALALAAVYSAGHSWLQAGGHLVDSYLSAAAQTSVDGDQLRELTTQPLARMLSAVFPLLAVGLVAMVGVQLTQGGLVWLPDRVLPDLSRVSPANASRLLSADSAIRSLFAALKWIAGLAVMLVAIWLSREPLWAQHGTLLESMTNVGAALARIILAVVGTVTVLSLAEYGARLWSYYRSLRMSANELRDEQRGRQAMRVESSLPAGDNVRDRRSPVNGHER